MTWCDPGNLWNFDYLDYYCCQSAGPVQKQSQLPGKRAGPPLSPKVSIGPRMQQHGSLIN